MGILDSDRKRRVSIKRNGNNQRGIEGNLAEIWNLFSREEKPSVDFQRVTGLVLWAEWRIGFNDL